MSGDRRHSVAWAVEILRRQGMPPDEIRAVLVAGEPTLVHRFLELHEERLVERVGEQRRTIASVERLLSETIGQRHLPRGERRGYEGASLSKKASVSASFSAIPQASVTFPSRTWKTFTNR